MPVIAMRALIKSRLGPDSPDRYIWRANKKVCPAKAETEISARSGPTWRPLIELGKLGELAGTELNFHYAKWRNQLGWARFCYTALIHGAKLGANIAQLFVHYNKDWPIYYQQQPACWRRETSAPPNGSC